MIVKSIQREIVSKLLKHPDFDISTSIIMSYFNKTMKKLLKQNDKYSVSNAGFDGGIIYYNRRTQVLKFTGAQTPLFYITTDGELHTIKAERYSVGYKQCSNEHEYIEHVLYVKEGMKFFISTDGYFDQNGGRKDFPFGKTRFVNIIKQNYQKPLHQLKQIFIQELEAYQNMILNNEQNDDITVIGFEIPPKSMEVDTQEIFKYEGALTQNVIATAMDNIEQIDNMNLVSKISTITIEFCQNMMNYSKDKEAITDQIVPRGYIEIKYYPNEYYEIIAKNVISAEDKSRIEPRLQEIVLLDRDGIKRRYRELRKSGKHTHKKGGGIGFYEIAKIAHKMEYNFKQINSQRFLFTIKAIVKTKK